MSSRLFRHTASRKFYIAKVALATLTITAIFLGNVTAVFAQSTDPYDAYVHLFSKYSGSDPVSGGTPGETANPPTESGVYWIPEQNQFSFNDGITRFRLRLNLITPKIRDNQGIDTRIWDLVAYDGSVNNTVFSTSDIRDIFLVHVYGKTADNKDINIIKKVLYSENSNNQCVFGNYFGHLCDTYTKTSDLFGHAIFKQSDTSVLADNNIALDFFTGYNGTEKPISYDLVQDSTEKIPYGTALNADLWYCGGDPTAVGGNENVKEPGDWSSIPDNLPDADKSHVQFFKDPKYCGGTAYWKIGPTITFTLPKDATEATTINQTGVTPPTASYDLHDKKALPECGVTEIPGCLARIVYYITFKPIAWLAALFGKLFDFFIGYSVSDESYRLGFAVRGWQLVRDISNIFFILILVWTGFAAVFGISKFSMKQIVPALIINAVIINFSLFATRTVIDFSNIFARVFYSRIYVCSGPCVDDNHDGVYDNLKRALGGYWPLSEKIVSSFDPQSILHPSIIQKSTIENPDINKDTADCKEGSFDTTVSGDCLSANGMDTGSSEYAGYFIIVSLIAAAIMFAILKMFWGVAFMFLGRVIGLYICMIFAPFAFLSRKIPFLEKIDELSWGKWSGNLTNYALLAPIFIFYLYIVYSFLSTKFLADFGLQQTGGSFFESVLYIAIPMLIIYFLIDYGKKLAKKYAGEIGERVQAAFEKLGGVAAGVATGSAGVLGRNIIGGAAALANKSRFAERLRARAAQSKWNVGSRMLLKTFKRGEESSFDFRKSSLGGKFFKELGVDADQKNLNALSRVGIGFGTNVTDGGYKGKADRTQEKKEKESKLYETKRTPEQIAKDYEKENEKRQKENEEKTEEYKLKTKEYEEKRKGEIDEQIAKDRGISLNTVQQMQTVNPTFYKQYADTALQNADLRKRLDAIEKPKEPKLKNEIKTAADVNNMHREAFQDRLKNGDFLAGWADQLEKYIDTHKGFGKLMAQVGAGLVGTVGNVTGELTKHEANKKAAKKLGELSKIQEGLSGIERVVTKGFRDLIALEKFQNSATFTALSQEEREKIIGGKKSMYDILSDQEKEEVDDARKSIEKDKERFEQYAELVRSREANKYDRKDLSNRKKTAQEAWATNPSSATRQAFFDILKEMNENKKNEDIWRNYSKYVEEQKKKMEGGDKK